MGGSRRSNRTQLARLQMDPTALAILGRWIEGELAASARKLWTREEKSTSGRRRFQQFELASASPRKAFRSCSEFSSRPELWATPVDTLCNTSRRRLCRPSSRTPRPPASAASQNSTAAGWRLEIGRSRHRYHPCAHRTGRLRRLLPQSRDRRWPSRTLAEPSAWDWTMKRRKNYQQAVPAARSATTTIRPKNSPQAADSAAPDSSAVPSRARRTGPRVQFRSSQSAWGYSISLDAVCYH